MADLIAIRRRGQKPEEPVAIVDSHAAKAWACAHCMPGSLIVDRRDIAEDFTAFVGLDVWLVTDKPAAQSVELGFALSEVCRYVTVFGLRDRRAEFLSSMGARA